MPTPPPWQRQELGYGARLGLLFLSALLLVIALTSLLVALGISSSFQNGTIPLAYRAANMRAAVVTTVLCVVSAGGLRMLQPALRSPAHLRPDYGVISPALTAHPFAVRFVRHYAAPSLYGTGTVQFTPAGLHIQGHHEPSIPASSTHPGSAPQGTARRWPPGAPPCWRRPPTQTWSAAATRCRTTPRARPASRAPVPSYAILPTPADAAAAQHIRLRPTARSTGRPRRLYPRTGFCGGRPCSPSPIR